MLTFAYDGSIHSDWASHYAARLATRHPEKTLQLVHVRENHLGEGQLEAKLERISAECDRLGVALRLRIEPLRGSVIQTIRSTLTEDSGDFLVCGTRVLERNRGLLSGTVAERLLGLARCNVLALRIVQPGLLGCPRSLLLPVSEHLGGFRSGLPFLKLFGSDAVKLHILFVRRVARWRFRMLSSSAANQLHQHGQTYCERIEHEIGEQLGMRAAVVDANAVVSDDVPKEIVIAANKTKSQLIYLGASERNLKERFFYGNSLEQVLRDATCDVAIYRGVE